MALADGYLLRAHAVAQQAPDERTPHVAGAQNRQLKMTHAVIVPGAAGTWMGPAGPAAAGSA
jgi:hypothetical protein